MMTRQVYLAGYGGRTREWLASAAHRHDATVIDIRYSPRSRRPEWSKRRLAAFLGNHADGTARYVHIPEWGNANYRNSGDIVIADFAAGLERWEVETHSTILLCQCPNVSTCHRKVVADLLSSAREVTVTDLHDVVLEADAWQATFLERTLRDP